MIPALTHRSRNDGIERVPPSLADFNGGSQPVALLEMTEALPTAQLMQVTQYVRTDAGYRYRAKVFAGDKKAVDVNEAGETGLVEAALARPVFAQKLGIEVYVGKETRIARIQRGGSQLEFVDDVEVEYGDADVINTHLEKNGFRFRYYHWRGEVPDMHYLEQLAREDHPYLPYSDRGILHFHDLGAHRYEGIPDDLWPHLQERARFFLRLLKDPAITALLSHLTPENRTQLVNHVTMMVVLWIEVLSVQSDYIKNGAKLRFSPFILDYLCDSPKKSGRQLVRDLREMARGRHYKLKPQDSYEAETLRSLADRVSEIAKSASSVGFAPWNPILGQLDPRYWIFLSRWQKELDAKFGPLADWKARLAKA